VSILNDREARLVHCGVVVLIDSNSENFIDPSQPVGKTYFSQDEIKRRMEEDRERVCPCMGNVYNI